MHEYSIVKIKIIASPGLNTILLANRLVDTISSPMNLAFGGTAVFAKIVKKNHKE